MENTGKFQKLLSAFIRINTRFNELNKKKYTFGTDVELFPSEIHTIEAIGMNMGLNVTELASIMGITKGAISQIIRKLEDKKLIARYQRYDNNQQVLLMLTEKGKTAFHGHEQFHRKQYDFVQEELSYMSDKEIDFLEQVFNSIEKSFEAVD